VAQRVLIEGGAARRRRRRRRLLVRGAPAAALGFAVAALLVIILTSGGPDQRAFAARYVRAWVRGDYGLMYSLLDRGSQATLTRPAFVAQYRRAAATATVAGLGLIRVGSVRHDVVPVRMRVTTRLFGALRETLELPLVNEAGVLRVRFDPRLTFPGLLPGEHLHRRVHLPPRATLLASNGTPLAQGPDRTSPIASVAAGIVGTLGPIPADQRAAYAAAGYPPNAKVGLDGLERIFQAQLAGRAGGELLAGARTLARRTATPGHDVTTTIDPTIEQAVITAIGGGYAGMVAMDPRSGAVRGVAGVGFSALQPPGSTMKIITASAALQAGLVKLSDSFPVRTSATIEGYTLQNANGEACGGTFLNAFAVSCNSVFAPLGARIGARRLVAMAERFGFNQPPSIPYAGESRIPSATAIGGDLAVGSSAIGQGRVLASALEMTDVGATIAMGGRRPIPTLVAGAPPRFVSVTSPRVADLVQRMMIAVVQFGTGTAAQIPGVQVAGKTGTAELRNTTLPGNSSASNTDAWFVGYAPVGAPRIVVGALFPNQGAGGAAAAPPVHDVLVAALQH
jgi:cell division protein FtsI/penicillin-binding protein 2